MIENITPPVKAVLSDESLPEAVDVVVVGGGIIGCASAYFLAQRGFSVALVEKGRIAGEQSSRNWGWCRQQNRDRREMPLSVLAMQLWDRLADEIGQDLGFRRSGLVYATDDEKALAEWEAWRPIAREFNVDTVMLSANEAADLIPENMRKWVGGLHSRSDGKAEPSLAAPVLAEGARALGATIHQQCAAYGLDTSNGRVTGVHTERGLIHCNAVICAAGAWASRFLRPHGVTFPQASVRQTALRTAPVENVGQVLYCPDLAMTRRLDGSYTLAISGKATLELTPQGIRFAKQFMPQFIKRLKAVQMGIGPSFISGPESLRSLFSSNPAIFTDHRKASPEPIERLARQVVKNVIGTFPQLAGLKVTHSWGAFVDCTPDAVPVISTTDGLDGVVLAAGSSGHGFGLGPGIAHLAADLAVNDTPSVDPEHFKLARLSDWTNLEVGSL